MWNFMKSCLTLVACLMNISLQIRLAPIYWNSTNTIFKSSTSPEPIQAKLEYHVDLVCPNYEKQDSTPMETYIIYQVSRDEYEKCDLRDLRYMLLNCSSPLSRRRYTLRFLSFQPIPNSPEYKEGQTYYIMTTSSGRMDGLSNRVHGACLTQNMKLSFYIQPSVVNTEPQKPNRSSGQDIYSKPNPNQITTTEKTTSKPIRKFSSHTYSVNTLQQTQTNSKQFQGSGTSASLKNAFQIFLTTVILSLLACSCNWCFLLL